MRRNWSLALLVALLVAGPALAADQVIFRGIDTFITPSDGTTVFRFGDNPIPAGFLCATSEAYSGTISFNGLPLVTSIPGQLGQSDTVVERLDDARFDAAGIAQTRIRMRALSLVSQQPFATACGNFWVYASLAGEQRITVMQIYRQNENGGYFTSPLAVDAKLRFVPVSLSREQPRELLASVDFPVSVLVPWTRPDKAPGAIVSAAVRVDTNGDGRPDANLPGTSNFAAAWGAPGTPNYAPNACRTCCHDDTYGCAHCYQSCNGGTFCPEP
jgi:hypothetical protein